MKKYLLQLSIAILLIISVGFQNTMAQEKKTSTISITIEEEGKVTTDTTFELKEGQDPMLIKKVITSMAGGDAQMKHISKDVHVSQKGDNKMVWISKGDDHSTWHAESMMEDINLDSIKEAHEGGKVMVFKNEDGDITVKELDDEHVMHMDDLHGEHAEMMFVETDDDGEVITIKKIKGGKDLMMISEGGDVHKKHKMIIHTEDGDCEGKEKKIEVIVHGDEDMKWVEEGDENENVEVYTIKTDDGEDVKVVKKKIRVEIEEEQEGEEHEEGEKVKKTVKKKKKK